MNCALNNYQRMCWMLSHHHYYYQGYLYDRPRWIVTHHLGFPNRRVSYLVPRTQHGSSSGPNDVSMFQRNRASCVAVLVDPNRHCFVTHPAADVHSGSCHLFDDLSTMIGPQIHRAVFAMKVQIRLDDLSLEIFNFQLLGFWCVKGLFNSCKLCTFRQ